jgi:putative transposase
MVGGGNVPSPGLTALSSSDCRHFGDVTPRWPGVGDAELVERIREIHRISRRSYGSPRVHDELVLGEGRRIGRKRIERLMRVNGIVGIHKRRRGCTRRDPEATPSDDLVNRQFNPEGPDRLWIADVTEHPTGDGKVYLAVVIDAWSRRVIGWSIADHMRAELVVDALQMAAWRRRPPTGQTVHHSDHGSQYTSWAFGRRLRRTRALAGSVIERQRTVSLGRCGNGGSTHRGDTTGCRAERRTGEVTPRAAPSECIARPTSALFIIRTAPLRPNEPRPQRRGVPAPEGILQTTRSDTERRHRMTALAALPAAPNWHLGIDGCSAFPDARCSAGSRPCCGPRRSALPWAWRSQSGPHLPPRCRTPRSYLSAWSNEDG